jgi:hypothetical protein
MERRRLHEVARSLLDRHTFACFKVWFGAAFSFAALLILLTGGCYQPRQSADHLASRDAAVDAGGADAANAPSESMLRFRVRTTPLGGRYAPRNVGAVWIEDASGTFVKTLEVWAASRKRYLRRFLMSSGGDATDAITSATLTEHVEHEIEWNLTGRDGLAVADGDYQLLVELTDRDASGDSIAVPFTKSLAQVRFMPMDTEHFHDMMLTLE